MRRDRRKLIIVLAAIPALLMIALALDMGLSALLRLVDRPRPQVSEPKPQTEARFRPVEAPTPTPPAVEGKAFGALKPFDRAKSLKSPLATPAPDIWLESPPPTRGQSGDGTTDETTPAVRVRLPSESEQLLREHWKVLCTYYHLELTDNKDREARYERAMNLSYARMLVSYKLSMREIDAPDGRRKITLGEVKDIKEALAGFAKGVFSPFDGA